MKLLVAFLILLPSLAFGLPDAPTGLDYSVPSWVLDGSLQTTIYSEGTEGWVLGAYLGNFNTSPTWQDGPRLEVGGMKPGAKSCKQADDKMYCVFGASAPYNVIEIDETVGTARLFMGSDGSYTGPTEEAQGGYVLYDDSTSTLYVSGPYCLRKIVDDGDGTRSVEAFAGECGTVCVSSCDGSGTDARFGDGYGWAVNPDGNIYFVEDTVLRKITPAGVVTTVTVTRPETPFNLWNYTGYGGAFLHAGENADTLYLDDQYSPAPSGYTAVKIDLTTNVITRLAGVIKSDDPYSRHGKESDGPALTHVGFRGGMRGEYSPFYSTYFMSGQDSTRMRRLTPDGWVKTCMLSTRPGTHPPPYTVTMAQNGEYYSAEWARLERITGGPPIPWFHGVDDRGGLYIGYSRNLNQLWRAYNPLEGGTP